MSDPWFSAKDTIDYYQRMTSANGGEAKVKGWSRLFLSPGMGHCSGGTSALDTFDFLTPAVNWVEKTRLPNPSSPPAARFPAAPDRCARFLSMRNTTGKAIRIALQTMFAGSNHQQKVGEPGEPCGSGLSLT